MCFWQRTVYFSLTLILSLAGTNILSGQSQQQWVDSIMKKLTFKQMVAQTLMIPVWTRTPELDNKVIYAVEKLEVGSLIFFQGTPTTHLHAVNFYQQQAKTPLIIGMDAEWGPSMRLDHVKKFPYAMTLGAIDDLETSYLTGKEIGQQLKKLGVHINFGPVVDVNSNPNNPIIGFRSFGDNPTKIGEQASAYNKGMESAGVWGCAKHFPGHGNTIADSHLELPHVTHDKKSIKKDLAPFNKLIDEGVKSIMVAHLEIPFLDETSTPTSLSKKVITSLLREDLGFEGLIITDALNMHGISKHFDPITAGIKALEAGNDILCMPGDPEGIINKAYDLYQNGEFDSVKLAKTVFRILNNKYDLGLSIPKNKFSQINNIYSDLNSLNHSEKSARESIQFYGKSNGFPWKEFDDTLDIFNFGRTIPDAFLNRCKYHSISQVHWINNSSPEDVISQIKRAKKCILINGDQKMFGPLTREIPALLKSVLSLLPYSNNSAFIHCGNVYALQDLECNIPLILGWETGNDFLEAAVDKIFGGLAPNRSLSSPVKLGMLFDNNARNIPRKKSIWEKENPLKLGFYCDESESLAGIMDSILLNNVSQSSELLVIKNGKIAYKESRGGYPVSNSKYSSNESTLYDIASVTKVAAMTIAVMKVVEEQKIDLRNSIRTYWKDLDSNSWSETPIYRFLTHQSGLVPFLPLASDIIKDKSYRYWTTPDFEFDEEKHLLLSSQVFTEKRWSDSVWDWIKIAELKVDNIGKYVYSDLNAIILGKWVESITGVDLDKYVDSVYYEPLGLKLTTFNPWKKGLITRCAPTEISTVLERGRIEGIVHDPSSLLLGGVAGNAGLFSTTEELAVIMQMLVNGGTWENKKFLKPRTIGQFTKTYLDGNNYRGLGFDKPNGFPNLKKNNELKWNNVFDYAPLRLFGHSGFTGAWAWADPKEKLIFIFLSNRTFPYGGPNYLAKKGYRGKLLEIVYRGLKK